MFTLQLKCPKCGFHTPTEEDGTGDAVLFSDELNSDWTICTCLDCRQFFQRRVVDGKPVDKCRICGGENIVVHESEHQSDVCPVCGFAGLEVDSSTISHYS